MRALGETCLLMSLVASGYGAFLSVWLGSKASRMQRRIVVATTIISLVGSTITIGILIWALVSRDFHFEYVAQYVSRYLAPRYCLSALWVGQGGSLLLWAWMTAVVAIVLRVLPSPDNHLRNTAFGFVLGYVFFLLCVIAFAADPMAPSVIAVNQGAGLSPLLQHPSMLVHPPIVFLAYSVWAVPCALALAALTSGRLGPSWTQIARSWSLAAWTLLGVGLLLGAHWAYQELGWGGYWGWDPVENGSLLPWLTGTAFIHSLMVWRHRGALKKTAIGLAIITFGLCNFSTFLTRSGIFSSVHAFSESPIGWMFLGLMSLLFGGGAALLSRRRRTLGGQRFIGSMLARETFIIVSIFLLLSLTLVVLIGTLVAPLSRLFVGRMIQIGPAFYNNVLRPIGLCLLTMTAMVPLLRWGAPPTAGGRRLLSIGLIAALVAVATAWATGLRLPLALVVLGLVVLTIAALVATYLHDLSRHNAERGTRRLMSVLSSGRRKYAAYCIHFGFVCVAMGVSGSSLGTQRRELTLDEGAVVNWAGHRIRYLRLEQRQLPDMLVAEAVLEVDRGRTTPIELRPARHLHLLQNQWTTEVAIYSTWTGDFYTVLNAGLGGGKIALTLVNNPMIRWIWAGGSLTTLSAIVAIWPSRRKAAANDSQSPRSEALTSCDERTARAA